MLWAAPRQQLHNTKLFDWSHFLMQQLRSKASGSTLWETAQGFYGSTVSFVRLHIVYAGGGTYADACAAYRIGTGPHVLAL